MRKQLYRPEANDDNIKLFNGETTNIVNVVNPKYPEYINYMLKAYSNNWLPQKVANFEKDRYQYYNVLTNKMREAYDSILSFLIYLDSIQTNNLPNIANYVTAPEFVIFLARQTWDEALHSYSYSYILSNMVNEEDFNKIIYKWKDNKYLKDRNAYIAKLYDDNGSDMTNKKFLILLIANYLLEGLYFYNGFQFFHALASLGLMISTDTEIRYIQRDENIHCAAFMDAINIFRNEYPEDFDTELIYDLFRNAAKLEIEFSVNIIGNSIIGMNKDTITDYTYYLCNMRLTNIGLEPIFEKTVNPYKHLDRLAAIDDESTNRTNQFETTSIAYKSPEIFSGWDNFDEPEKEV